MKKISVSLATAVANSVFNKSEWKPVGDAYTLEEVCDATGIFPYKDIEGDEAEVSFVEFGDNVSARLNIKLKSQKVPFELKAGKAIKNGYDEGDTVKIDLIYGQELVKAGQPSIFRFDVWESEEAKNEYLKERDK